MCSGGFIWRISCDFDARSASGASDRTDRRAKIKRPTDIDFVSIAASSDRRTNIHIDRHTDKEADTQADRQIDRQAGTQTIRQADRQTGRHAGRQSDRQKETEMDMDMDMDRDKDRAGACSDPVGAQLNLLN